MTKMAGETRGGKFCASESWSGQVHFESHMPEWRVSPKLKVQPWTPPQNFKKVHNVNTVFDIFIHVVYKIHNYWMTSNSMSTQ